MKLEDQIQVYRLEEDLEDLVIETALNEVDQQLPVNVSGIEEDELFRQAWETAASVNHKSLSDRITWLKQHGWNEERIVEKLIDPGASEF